MKKKPVLLFLSLALPVAIVLFLRMFGKNRFDLPVLHNSSEEWPSRCDQPSAFPFFVPESVLRRDGRNALVLFQEPARESALRLPVEIDTTKTQLLHLYAMASPPAPCLFGAAPGSSALLIDSQGRLRSIYTNLDRKEADRAIMESKILNSDY